MSDALFDRLDQAAAFLAAHHCDAKAIDDAKAEIVRLREALTPSGDTKAAYMGEFSFKLQRIDEFGDEYSEKVYVPWTTIKEIMAAIRARATAALEQKP